jgi:hypothetical protein
LCFCGCRVATYADCMLNATTWKHLHEHSLPLVRNEEHKRLLKEAADLIGVCDQVPDEIDPRRLANVLDTICLLIHQRSRIVGGYGCTWLWCLASKHELAAARLRQEFARGKAHTRLFLVQYCFGNKRSGTASMSLAMEVLRDALRDRSKEVRLFAAGHCRWRELHEIAPFLEAAIAVEQDPKCHRAMQTSLDDLLRGYHLEGYDSASRRPSDEMFIAVVVPGCSVGVSVPNEIVQKISLDEMAARIRARQRDRTIPGDRFDPIPPEKQFLGAWPMQDIQPQEHRIKPYIPR